jgi:hypothetical protein
MSPVDESRISPRIKDHDLGFKNTRRASTATMSPMSIDTSKSTRQNREVSDILTLRALDSVFFFTVMGNGNDMHISLVLIKGQNPPDKQHSQAEQPQLSSAASGLLSQVGDIALSELFGRFSFCLIFFSGTQVRHWSASATREQTQPQSSYWGCRKLQPR